MKEKKVSPQRKYAVPAVDSMLDILECLSESPKPRGVSELSRALGISTNLAFRIMKRLVDRGYAETSGTSAEYQLGPRFFSLGMRLYHRFELRRRALRHLEALSAETGEMAQIQVLDGDRMLALDCVSPRADFYLNVVPGSSLACHANAFGKAVLAFSPTEALERALAGGMGALTPNTIVDKARFLDELAVARATGVTYDREEYSLGIFCVGAPVFDVNGEVVAGLGVTGLISRFDPRTTTAVETAVLSAAGGVAADVGYAGDFYETKKARRLSAT